jgi:hypothetical protein
MHVEIWIGYASKKEIRIDPQLIVSCCCNWVAGNTSVGAVFSELKRLAPE